MWIKLSVFSRRRRRLPPDNRPIETNGSGVGLIDYDKDGWLDIYVGERFNISCDARKIDTAARRAFPR